jgi:Mg/Co/Ni transporter MgtE
MLRDHPDQAALVLDQHPTASGLDALSRAAVDDAAEVLRRLSPSRACEVVALLPTARAAGLLGALDLDHAARIARRLAPELWASIVALLDARHARALASLLAFREDTAGALMDPEVLALPARLTAAAALARVRNEPDHARYNLYVVDEDGRLLGALNLRELLLARPETPLADLMVHDPLHLGAEASRAEVVSHPGWREVHSLPVVDATGHYLGALRYRTLRDLEDELLRRSQADTPPSRAFGELLAVGVAGALEALAGVAAGSGEESPHGS